MKELILSRGKIAIIDDADRIKVDKKQRHLGRFDTFEDAVAARNAAEAALGI